MSLSPSHSPSDPVDLKSCCAALYESDFARMLLGESFHPGGLRLTRRLGELLDLHAGMRVLDVASGKGDSAVFLAGHFGCEVVGVDFGPENVKTANARANGLVSFVEGDAERLHFEDASFDTVICECAFCTFPEKEHAAAEFARVLRPGGRVGLSDLTRTGPLSPELEGLLAWVACIADARPVEEYSAFLAAAGISGIHIEIHDTALIEMVKDIKGRLLGFEVATKLGKLNVESFDFEHARQLARAALEAIRTKRLGYALIVGNHATR